MDVGGFGRRRAILGGKLLPGIGRQGLGRGIPSVGAFDALQAAGITFYGLVGTKRLLSSYTGSGFTYSRSSDLATQTFAAGTPSTTIAAWAQAAGPAILTIIKPFDQSGNTRDGTTNLVVNGLIVDLSVWDFPDLKTDGTNRKLNLSGLAGFTNNQPGIVFGVNLKLDTTTIATPGYAIGFSKQSFNAQIRDGIRVTSTQYAAIGNRRDIDPVVSAVAAAALDTVYHRAIFQADYVTDRKVKLTLDGTTTVSAATAVSGNTDSSDSLLVSEGTIGSSANPWPAGSLGALFAIQATSLTAPQLALADAALLAAQPKPRFLAMVNEATWNGGIGQSYANTIRPFAMNTLTADAADALIPVVAQSTVTTVSIRVRRVDTAATVIAWTTLCTPTNGVGSGTVTLQGAWGLCYVDISGDGGTTWATAYTQITASYIIASNGQSNEEKPMGQRQAIPIVAGPKSWRAAGGNPVAVFPSDFIKQIGEASGGPLVDGGGGDAVTQLLNGLATSTGRFWCMVQGAIGATLSTTWVSAANGGTHTSWDDWVTRFAAPSMPTAYNFGSWCLGETDAVNGVSGANHAANVAFVEAQMRTQSGRADMPFLIRPIGTDGTATAANNDAIRQAIYSYIATNASGKVYPRSTYAARVATNDPHYNTTQYISVYAGDVEVYLQILGLATYGGKGPNLTTATASVATQRVTLPVTLDGGSGLATTDLATTGVGITGFVVNVNGTPATISSTAFSGLNIQLNLAALSFIISDTVTVTYLYGKPVNSNTVWDNNACQYDTLVSRVPGRPLQASIGAITATVGA